MKLVSNPYEEGKLYHRYEKTIGVDIAVDDGTLFKNPNEAMARCFDITKFPDVIHTDPTTFEDPYVNQSIDCVSTSESRYTNN